MFKNLRFESLAGLRYFLFHKLITQLTILEKYVRYFAGHGLRETISKYSVLFGRQIPKRNSVVRPFGVSVHVFHTNS